MSLIEDFDLILSNFNKVEERFFLDDIATFAEKHKNIVLRSFSILLKDNKISIQLRYLVLKAIGRLRYPEFVPMIQEVLKREEKIQLINEAINCLVRINNLFSYKIIVHYLRNHAQPEHRVQIEEILKEFFSKNKLVYHFDVFYRDRSDTKAIDRSCDFLIENLPDDYIKELLPTLSSKSYTLRFEILRLLKKRPSGIYYSYIYNYFRANHRMVDEKFFLLLADAMVVNAAMSKMADKIFSRLLEHLPELSENQQNILTIMLLKLDTPAIIPRIEALYPDLDFELKMLFFANVKREDFGFYIGFMRHLFVEEDQEQLLEQVIQILMYAKDFDYLFQALKRERKLRKEKILRIVLEADPPGIDVYVKEYVYASEDNYIMSLSLEYLLRHAPDNYFDLARKVFFAGLPVELKVLIVRSLQRFSPQNRKVFVESIMDNIASVELFKRDFLFALLMSLNEKVFDKHFSEKILNRILMMMEEAKPEELVNYIYFFEKFEIPTRKDMDLIIEELRLIQNTLLKTNAPGDIIRMIHILVKNIEKRATLKGFPGEKRPPAEKTEKKARRD